MKKLNYLLLVFGFISFSLVSCGDDDNGNGNVYTGSNCYSAWASAYSESSQEIASAAQAYGMNPTQENCNAYKSAYQKLLNDVKPFQNCAAIPTSERQQFLDEVEEAENNIDDLC